MAPNKNDWHPGGLPIDWPGEMPSLPPTAFSSLEWRDALLRKMLELSREGRPSAVALSDVDGLAAAALLTSMGRAALLIAWPADDPFAAVRIAQRIDSVRQSLRPNATVDVIVIGGELNGRRLCEEQSAQRSAGRLSFHHLLEDGRVWSAGRGLPAPIQKALQGVEADLVRGEPLRVLSQAEIVTARTAYDRMASSEQAAIRLLTSKRWPVTKGLLGILVAIYILELIWTGTLLPWGAASGSTLFKMGATDRASLLQGEWWRLLTPAFLHANVIHIVVNGWSLWILGKLLEPLLGSARFIVIYGATAVVAALASTFGGTAMSVGASGAILGLFGALFALALWPRGVLPVNMASRLRGSLWQTLILNVFISRVGGIDWRAHLGGAVAGFLIVMSGVTSIGLPPLEVRAASGARSRGWAVAAVLVVLIMAAALGAGFGNERPWEHGTGPLARVTIPGTHVSLEIPKALKAREESHTDDTFSAAYGVPGGTEIVVAAVVQDELRLADLPPAQLRDEIMKSLDPGKDDKVTIKQPARVTDTPDGLLGMRVDEVNGFTISTWVVMRGTTLVRLEVVTDPETPAEWNSVAHGLIDSVQVGAD